jgi:hypothetical protein
LGNFAIERLLKVTAEGRNTFMADCADCGARHTSVFCQLGHKQLEALNSVKSCVGYRKGRAVFHEGGHPPGISCINAGNTKLERSGRDGNEQIVRLAKGGVGYRPCLAVGTIKHPPLRSIRQPASSRAKHFSKQ